MTQAQSSFRDENDAVRDKRERKIPEKVIFGDFEAAEAIASKLIPKHHSELGSARFRYICRSKAAKRGGQPVAGNVYKMSGKGEHLSQTDFVLEIALDVWNPLNPMQRNALVDHLLTRCVGEEDEKTGEMKWRVRPPEVQEFPEVAERHGQWNEGLIEIAKCLQK
jgi:Putative phage metallopeptidase